MQLSPGTTVCVACEAVIRTDEKALIVGGGLAGSMVALELARGGRPSVLLERSSRPRNIVCGEFLSSETIHYLARHRVDLAELGAVPIAKVRVALPRHILQEDLPFPAYSLTRFRLDEELLRRAAMAGVDVQRDCHVNELEEHSGMWHVSARDGRTFRSADVFLATGKHDLRGWPRPAGTQRGLVAFKMYFTLTAQQHTALGNAVELILFRGGYAGLQPVEGGRVNLCLLVTARRLQQAGSTWAGLLPDLLRESSHLADRLHGAVPLLDAPLAASHIPYGHMQAESPGGLWRVGDQAAVIPSFCGDGMAIALHSGALAARHYLLRDRSVVYQGQLRRHLGHRLAFATRLSQCLVAFPAAGHIARLVPGLLSRIACMTRISDSVLLRDGQH